MEELKKQIQEVLDKVNKLKSRQGESLINIDNLKISRETLFLLNAELEALTEELYKFNNETYSLSKSWQTVLDNAKNTNGYYKLGISSLDKTNNIVRKIQLHTEGISKLNKTQIRNLIKQQAVQVYNLGVAQQELTNIEDRTNREEELLESINATFAKRKEQQSLLEETLSTLEKVNKMETNRANALGFTGALLKSGADLASKIGLSNIDDILESSYMYAENLADEVTRGGIQAAGMKGSFEVMVKSMIDLGKGILTELRDPLIMIPIAAKLVRKSFKLILDLVLDIDETTVKLARNFGVTKGEAEKMHYSLRQAAYQTDNIHVTSQDISKAFTDISSRAGTFAKLSDHTLDTFALMNKNAGITEDALFSMYQTSVLTGQELDAQMKSEAGRLVVLQATTNSAISQKEVFEEMKNISDSNRLILIAQGKSLLDQVFRTKQVGLNMQQTEQIANSLLNFEDSIAAEMEAELLTGKQLNLEKARLYALQGKTAELAEEIAKQGITANKYGKMNVIQQEAMAKAFGMSKDELAKVLTQQSVLNQLSKTAASLTEEQRGKVLSMIEQGKISQKELNELGEDYITKLANTATFQEKLGATFSKIKDKVGIELASKLMPVLDYTSKVLEKIPDAIFSKGALVTFVGGVLGFALLAKKILFKGTTKKDALWVRMVNEGRGIGDDFFGGGGMGGGTYKDKSGRYRTRGGRFARVPKSRLGKAVAAGRGVLKRTSKSIGSSIASSGIGKKALGSLGKFAGKGLLKGGGKSLLKKLPLIGALVSIGFALDRFKSGDVLGAVGEVMSGVASIVPGLGTAASAAIDAGLIARDVYKDSQIGKSPKTNSGGNVTIDAADFVIKPMKEDTIVAAGGTNLGRTDEMVKLLSDIHKALLEGGNIYIDGNKAGIALRGAEYKMG